MVKYFPCWVYSYSYPEKYRKTGSKSQNKVHANNRTRSVSGEYARQRERIETPVPSSDVTVTKWYATYSDHQYVLVCLVHSCQLWVRLKCIGDITEWNAWRYRCSSNPLHGHMFTLTLSGQADPVDVRLLAFFLLCKYHNNSISFLVMKICAVHSNGSRNPGL